MATKAIHVQRKDASGLTLLASLATLDAAKTPEYAPYDPDADQAYLDQAMDSRGTLDDGDTVYSAAVTVDLAFGSSADGAILLHTTAVSTNPDFSGVTLIDVIPLDMRDDDIDGKTNQEAMRYIAATTVGQSSGGQSGTETFKGLDGSTDRVQSTVDSEGDRTTVSLDP